MIFSFVHHLTCHRVVPSRIRTAQSSNVAARINACIATNYPVILPRPFSATADAESTNINPNPSPSRKPISVLESLPVTFADISRANVAIRNGVLRTQCKKSYFLSELLGAHIWLKTEFQQFTGSFKERGARNAIMQLLREQGDDVKQSGVIAASAGNHALALAYHGKDLGVPVTVVMPTVAPLAKVDKCRVSNEHAFSSFMHNLQSQSPSERCICTEIWGHSYN